ncbi:hypothetical protein [Haloplanus rubicundus]|uniref:Uncharacterized protein n=1 Tax=Haloplanus rubicundus TaxID=1547898 RepID=A0A345E8P4_9EURY|nr:hypothetical protein [Haloplanus rubicundus]AXG08566.1 hypothetical protein DU484_01125 [Haloplanus rubicundus]
MPSITRRRALSGAVALLTGFAGCSGESSSSSSYPPDPTGNIELNPESYTLRNSERAPTVWTGERPTPHEDEERVHRRHHLFVTSADEAAAVAFADVDGAADAREFLETTDYDAATVYVEQQQVGACFASDLCSVQWSDSDIQTNYARRYRDADVRCETDDEDVLAVLIRIPEAFDPSDVSSYGSSRGSGTCERENERIRRRRNASDDAGGAR